MSPPVGEGADGARCDWKLVKGPWFDNNLATLEVAGDGLRMWWANGHVEGDANDRPRLVTVSEVTIEGRAAQGAS